ncbi:glycophorin-C isoform X1 [Salmo trutta]|uniref:glycophorin-C isoform X1 n=2 Tax=Salmo trutta TaxID=8032 RepID=UPI00113010C3|nr:glycophorin-C-like isoform X1 [Salmo trutta]XP_029567159.1 glycophorin-C-like isoform X1 [Salmo trutta]XP_029567160.1 glycophorin-C-like isoform X1 [Salmo trutta]XP_029567161.1 glycophorin-C-like isoform X1 [Salmo trutta]
MWNSTAVAFNTTPDQAKPEAMTQPMPTSLSEAADIITPVDCDVGDGYFDAILGAVIAAVVLVLLCLAVVVIRYMYRHKGTYHTNEAKGTEFAETADAALRGDPALQDAMDESKKEYFI